MSCFPRGKNLIPEESTEKGPISKHAKKEIYSVWTEGSLAITRWVLKLGYKEKNRNEESLTLIRFRSI